MRQRSERRASSLSDNIKSSSKTSEKGERIGTLEATINGVKFLNNSLKELDQIKSGEPLNIKIKYSIHNSKIDDLILTFGIINEFYINCYETYIESLKNKFGDLKQSGHIECKIKNIPLIPGTYYVIVGLYPTNWDYAYDYNYKRHKFRVEDDSKNKYIKKGVLSLDHTWSMTTYGD